MRVSSSRTFYDEKQKQTQQERRESPLFAVRTFNNFIKSVQIADAVSAVAGERGGGLKGGLVLLDLAGGTGGDLSKYVHSPSIGQVVLVDHSSDSVAEAVRRYSSLAEARVTHGHGRPVYSARFFVTDAFSFAALQRSLTDFSPGFFDIVSCQFALHYAPDLDEAMRIVSHWLRPKGRFISTIPNADYILRNIDAETNSFCTDTFQIALVSETEYLFTMGEAVQNVAEHFIQRAALEGAAGRHGLFLAEWSEFPRYYDQVARQGKHAKLASRMGLAPTAETLTVAELYIVVELVRQ